MATQSPEFQPLAVSPEGAAEILSVPLRRVYQLLAMGELRGYKDGKRRCIPTVELRSYVERKMAGSR
jgi:excisionase family DNA binding protein